MFVFYTPRKNIIRALSSPSNGKVPDCPYSLTTAFSVTFAQAQVVTYQQPKYPTTLMDTSGSLEAKVLFPHKRKTGLQFIVSRMHSMCSCVH